MCVGKTRKARILSLASTEHLVAGGHAIVTANFSCVTTQSAAFRKSKPFVFQRLPAFRFFFDTKCKSRHVEMCDVLCRCGESVPSGVFTLYALLLCEMTSLLVLTLADRGPPEHGEDRGGQKRPPLAVRKRREIETSGKNEHAARHERKPMVSNFMVLGQSVTSQVRSMTRNWRKS